MKLSRIVELMSETESTLKDVIHDYGHVPMTEERAEIVADIIDLLDLVKDVRAEMRQGVEGKLKALQATIDVL